LAAGSAMRGLLPVFGGTGLPPVQRPACASASSDFFMLTYPGQISAAFAQTGTSISKLRVAR